VGQVQNPTREVTSIHQSIQQMDLKSDCYVPTMRTQTTLLCFCEPQTNVASNLIPIFDFTISGDDAKPMGWVLEDIAVKCQKTTGQ
jgi:hypothetical protein